MLVVVGFVGNKAWNTRGPTSVHLIVYRTVHWNELRPMNRATRSCSHLFFAYCQSIACSSFLISMGHRVYESSERLKHLFTSVHWTSEEIHFLKCHVHMVYWGLLPTKQFNHLLNEGVHYATVDRVPCMNSVAICKCTQKFPRVHHLNTCYIRDAVILRASNNACCLRAYSDGTCDEVCKGPSKTHYMLGTLDGNVIELHAIFPTPCHRCLWGGEVCHMSARCAWHLSGWCLWHGQVANHLRYIYDGLV